jgi:methylated-DNA-[protein]-cysteine S-methyltransferase
MSNSLSTIVVDSPVGPLTVLASEDSLYGVSYGSQKESNEPSSFACKAAQELEEYFAGTRKEFDLPLDWGGRTTAMQKMLEYTATIPAGETRSYGQVASAAGYPGAARAAGSALRNNPFTIIVPCHRVIRSDGSLGRYAGEDDGRKKKLLQIDKA